MTASPFTIRILAAFLIAMATTSVSFADPLRPATASDAEETALSQEELSALLAGARGNDPFADRPAVWWNHLERQLAASLGSRIDGVRHEALQLTITFAVRYPDRIGLRRTVPQLAYIYSSERDEGYRIMALSALHAIGGDYSMQLLSEAASHQTSARVRTLSNAALAKYRADR